VQVAAGVAGQSAVPKAANGFPNSVQALAELTHIDGPRPLKQLGRSTGRVARCTSGAHPRRIAK
jgi:hypothetical protein